MRQVGPTKPGSKMLVSSSCISLFAAGYEGNTLLWQSPTI